MAKKKKPYAWVLVDKDGNREKWTNAWFADDGFDPDKHPHGAHLRDEVATVYKNKARAPFRWMPLYI